LVGVSGHVGSVSPLEPSSGRLSWAPSRWHADNAHLLPVSFDVYDDVPRLFRDHILPGHAPTAPLLTPDATVVTLGSCFAQELRTVLERAQFLAANFWIPSGLNNTFAIADFVSWCVRGEGTRRAYRYDRAEDGSIEEWTPNEEREAYLEQFRRAGAFVFTLGLAEVWVDRETGAVFWRGVPEHIFEESRHEFRLSTVEENAANVVEIIELVRSVNADAPIVVTLSPVPLRATFRDISCITADCVSKSVLRVAIDTALAEARPNVYYWPAFELVKWAGAELDWRAYGGDARHVQRYLVYAIIDAFVESFYGAEAAATLRARLAGERDWPTRPPNRLRMELAREKRLLRTLEGYGRRAPARLRRELAARLAPRAT
jgi:hypothetical protein